MQLLRLPAVLAQHGRCAASIYGDIKKGLFPKPVRIGARAVAWPAHEISTLNAARIAGKSDTEIKRLVSQMHASRAGARGLEV